MIIFTLMFMFTFVMNTNMMNIIKHRNTNVNKKSQDVTQLGKFGMSKVSNVDSEDIMLKRVKQMSKVRKCVFKII
jgi:hypothetical protein